MVGLYFGFLVYPLISRSYTYGDRLVSFGSINGFSHIIHLKSFLLTAQKYKFLVSILDRHVLSAQTSTLHE